MFAFQPDWNPIISQDCATNQTRCRGSQLVPDVSSPSKCEAVVTVLNISQISYKINRVHFRQSWPSALLLDTRKLYPLCYHLRSEILSPIREHTSRVISTRVKCCYGHDLVFTCPASGLALVRFSLPPSHPSDIRRDYSCHGGFILVLIVTARTQTARRVPRHRRRAHAPA